MLESRLVGGHLGKKDKPCTTSFSRKQTNKQTREQEKKNEKEKKKKTKTKQKPKFGGM